MASDGTIKISTELDSSQAKTAMSKFSSYAKTAMAGVAAAAGTASAAIGAMTAYSIKVGTSFETGMSKVSAISGATGEDLQALTDKAKEMGAKTKFSASEAADAFQYMAMAGWKTNDMLDGIEGIMNLAAASGEDLATTSDIVTDALTAFGLKASDSAHFADVLAKASSNSNTNVSMMGETFKYVAPVAGALGFSAEDCAVAIGLMANSGIKASQSGTSLRQLFTNLVKPTDDMKTAMDELGISITDTNGNTKSLDTVMGDLRKAFSGLSESQKAQYAATLAGQERMSGLLAIVNASDGDFVSLKSSINNADGAAEEMAKTMNDNLKGSITIAGSALEGFGISVYEKMEAPLKSAVDKGTENINRLADAFNAGGLNGVVEEAGKIFNDTCDDIADFGGEAEGVVEPIRDIVNTGAKLAKDVLPKVRDGVKFTAKNLDVLAPVVVSSTAAFKAFSAIGKVTATQTKLNATAMATLTKMDKANALQLVATNGGLSARQIILAAANGQMTATTAITSLWATAQSKLNAVLAANPLGAIVAGGMALFGVYKALEAATTRQTEVDKEEAKALKEASKAAEGHAKASKERLDSYNEMVESQNTQAASDLNQLNNLKDLNNELQNIVDENGKVKEGYEDRAAFITSQLSSEAKGAVDGMLDQFDGMDKKTQKKFANAVYGALEGLEGFDKLKDPAKDGVDEFLESLRSALDEHSPSKKTEKIFELAMEGAENGVDSGKDGLLTKAGDVITEFLGKFSTDGEEGFGTKMQQAGASLMNFFGLGVSSKSEDSKSAGKANAEAAESGAGEIDPNETGQKFGGKYISGIGRLLKKTLNTGKANAEAAKSGAGSVDPSGTGNIFGSNYAAGVGSRAGSANTQGRTLGINAKSGAGSIDPSGTGNTFGSNYAAGIGRRTGSANAQGRTLGLNARSGAGSISGYDPGSSFGQGFVIGIGDWIQSAASKAAALAISAYNAAKRAIDSRSPSKKTKKLGKWFGQGFELGIEGEKQNVERASETISEAALDALNTEVLLDKLNELNASELLNKAYDASYERRNYVADKVIAAVTPVQDLQWRSREETQNVQLSDEDIKKLATAFAKAASGTMAKEIEGMSIRTKEREWARLVREVKG